MIPCVIISISYSPRFVKYFNVLRNRSKRLNLRIAQTFSADCTNAKHTERMEHSKHSEPFAVPVQGFLPASLYSRRKKLKAERLRAILHLRKVEAGRHRRPYCASEKLTADCIYTIRKKLTIGGLSAALEVYYIYNMYINRCSATPKSKRTKRRTYL